MAWTGTHRAFTVKMFLFFYFVFFKTGEAGIETQRAFRLILCYVGIMLLQIENRYCYGLKSLGRQVQRLKESQRKTSKLSIFRVMENFENRLQRFTGNRCHHVEGIIFQTKLIKTIAICLNNRVILFLKSRYLCLFVNL